MGSTEQPEKMSTLALTRRILFDKRFIIVTIVIIIAASILMPRHNPATHTSSAADKDNTTPNYQTILPRGESVREFGGWKRVSPPKNDPVFAYADSIDGVPISVSEQPLPESFTGDIDSKVADLAAKFNATNKINAEDTAVYIGTSVKGPQSTIFIKENVLVMIKSQKKIADASWANYVQSLRNAADSTIPKY